MMVVNQLYYAVVVVHLKQKNVEDSFRQKAFQQCNGKVAS